MREKFALVAKNNGRFIPFRQGKFSDFYVKNFPNATKWAYAGNCLGISAQWYFYHLQGQSLITKIEEITSKDYKNLTDEEKNLFNNIHFVQESQNNLPLPRMQRKINFLEELYSMQNTKIEASAGFFGGYDVKEMISAARRYPGHFIQQNFSIFIPIGHAVGFTCKITEHGIRYIFFDPNHGEFSFDSQNSCENFLADFFKKYYPTNLFRSSYRVIAKPKGVDAPEFKPFGYLENWLSDQRFDLLSEWLNDPEQFALLSKDPKLSQKVKSAVINFAFSAQMPSESLRDAFEVMLNYVSVDLEHPEQLANEDEQYKLLLTSIVTQLKKRTPSQEKEILQTWQSKDPHSPGFQFRQALIENYGLPQKKKNISQPLDKVAFEKMLAPYDDKPLPPTSLMPLYLGGVGSSFLGLYLGSLLNTISLTNIATPEIYLRSANQLLNFAKTNISKLSSSPMLQVMTTSYVLQKMSQYLQTSEHTEVQFLGNLAGKGALLSDIYTSANLLYLTLYAGLSCNPLAVFGYGAAALYCLTNTQWNRLGLSTVRTFNYPIEDLVSTDYKMKQKNQLNALLLPAELTQSPNRQIFVDAFRIFKDKARSLKDENEFDKVLSDFKKIVNAAKEILQIRKKFNHSTRFRLFKTNEERGTILSILEDAVRDVFNKINDGSETLERGLAKLNQFLSEQHNLTLQNHAKTSTFSLVTNSTLAEELKATQTTIRNFGLKG